MPASPFAQALLLVAEHRRQQVFDDAALVGLDLDRNRHARTKRDLPAIDRRGLDDFQGCRQEFQLAPVAPRERDWRRGLKAGAEPS
jgi:hypothetical protein